MTIYPPGTRADVAPPVSTLELPTLLLAIFVYGGWLVLTHAYGHWPLWVVAPAVAVLLTLHSSLQHEVLHGHPTRYQVINDLIGIVPLLTGIIGSCPAYTLFGFSTCQTSARKTT